MINTNSNNPTHVSIIMDGNGRWAENHGKSRIFGHRKGVDTVRKIVDACGQRRIPYLTLYAFSSENWNRPREEVRLLTELLFVTLEAEARRLHENGIRLRVIGDLKAFGSKIDQSVQKLEQLTKNNRDLNLTVAINYGGRWDLVNAFRLIANETHQSEEFDGSKFTEATIAKHLSTKDLPDPDLFIRTGGEIRVSNFLLWELAYSELYFTDILWPEFDENCLDYALASYRSRQRRFGRLNLQKFPVMDQTI